MEVNLCYCLNSFVRDCRSSCFSVGQFGQVHVGEQSKLIRSDFCNCPPGKLASLSLIILLSLLMKGLHYDISIM